MGRTTLTAVVPIGWALTARGDAAASPPDAPATAPDDRDGRGCKSIASQPPQS